MRSKIHDLICREHFNPQLNSFVNAPGSNALDASLLILAKVGFLPATDPRILGTVSAIEERLSEKGFVYRYNTHRIDDRFPPAKAPLFPAHFG